MCDTAITSARSGRRGGALLLVLWLAAALGAIALAVASSVRSETERTTTSLQALRCYYLASGAIDRALLYLGWGAIYRHPDGSSRYYDGGPRMALEFPGGQVTVEVIPESAKLNVNQATPEELYGVLLALGTGPERAEQIAAAIVDWRMPAQSPPTPLDRYYLDRNPSFLGRHASLEEIEELLVIQGMTPELFYGGFERDAKGGLRPRLGLRDCLSVYGGTSQFDVNTTPAPVLEAIGVPADTVAALVERRNRAPFRLPDEVAALGGGPVFGRLKVGGGNAFTLRATARLRDASGALTETRRSVEALIKAMDPSKAGGVRYHVLRWYDNVWVQ
jgi:general secretion pathway protein K